MKIKELSKSEMTLIVSVLDQFVKNVKGQKTASEVLGKLRADLNVGLVGLKATSHPFIIEAIYTSSELTIQEVDRIIFVLKDKIEDLRDQIDDNVISFEANDKDDSISDIINHLSIALKVAKEVHQLESIHENIVKQRTKAMQELTEKSNKIVELTAKVDTQQMVINGKDGEIISLKSALDFRDQYIYELECRLGRRCPDPIYFRGRPVDPRRF